MRRTGTTLRAACTVTGMVMTLCAAGCFMHPFTNPVDPRGDEYQGYRTVADVNDIRTASPIGGESVMYAEFSWDECTDADAYEFRIASDESMSDIVFTSGELTDNSVVISDTGLSEGTYWWQVHGRKDGSWGDWSGASSFMAVSGISNYSYGIISDQEITWNAIDGAAGYKLQVADSQEDVAGADWTVLSENRFSIEDLCTDCWWYWRVRPYREADDARGFWSEIYSFYLLPD